MVTSYVMFQQWRDIIKELFHGFKCIRAVIYPCYITINTVLCCKTNLSHFERRYLYLTDSVTVSSAANCRNAVLNQLYLYGYQTGIKCLTVTHMPLRILYVGVYVK